MEEGLILGQKGLEVLHVSRLYTSDNLVVREEMLLKIRIREDLSVRDISHQKLSDDLKLNDLKSEGLSSNFGALSQSLNETSLSLRVLKLDSLDATKIVEISGILIV